MRTRPRYNATARRTAIVIVLARAPADVLIPVATLAKAVGCTPAAVHQHVKALVAAGILSKPPWRVYREERLRTRAKIMAAIEQLGPNATYRVIGQTAGISTTRVREHLVAMGGPRRPPGGEAQRQRHLEVQAAILKALDQLGQDATYRTIAEHVGVSPAAVLQNLVALGRMTPGAARRRGPRGAICETPSPSFPRTGHE
jgi:predicted ArsR family transcriptional regulator